MYTVFLQSIHHRENVAKDILVFKVLGKTMTMENIHKTSLLLRIYWLKRNWMIMIV